MFVRRGVQLGIAVLDHGKGLIGQPEGQRHTPAHRQVAHKRLQTGAVEGMTQVDHQRGQQQHRQAGAAAEQGSGQ